jgi:hypothetical protein
VARVLKVAADCDAACFGGSVPPTCDRYGQCRRSAPMKSSRCCAVRQENTHRWELLRITAKPFGTSASWSTDAEFMSVRALKLSVHFDPVTVAFVICRSTSFSAVSGTNAIVLFLYLGGWFGWFTELARLYAEGKDPVGSNCK